MKIKFTDNSKEVNKAISKALAQALKISATNVQSEAKRRVPRDTGLLSKEIEVSIKDNEAFVYDNAEYAGYVHNGTFKQSAQPFLKDAFKAKQSEVNRVFKQLLGGLK